MVAIEEGIAVAVGTVVDIAVEIGVLFVVAELLELFSGKPKAKKLTKIRIRPPARMHKPATTNPSFVLREVGWGVNLRDDPARYSDWEPCPGNRSCPDCGGGEYVGGPCTFCAHW